MRQKTAFQKNAYIKKKGKNIQVPPQKRNKTYIELLLLPPVYFSFCMIV